MICYFWEGLKPSIKVEMKQQDRKSMNFKEMVQRAGNAEAKAGLRSSTMVRDSDVRCLRGYRPSHNTSSKVQTQGSSHKNSPRTKESKNKDPKLALPRGNTAEPAKKEDKKKKPWERKRERNKQTLATSDNTEAPKKKKKRRDSSKVTYFNCDKKDYYASNCTEPPKN